MAKYLLSQLLLGVGGVNHSSVSLYGLIAAGVCLVQECLWSLGLLRQKFSLWS